jgi:hypothetical protein
VEKVVSPEFHLIGSWKAMDATGNPVTLTFKFNETFSVDFDNDGKNDVWGKYTFFLDYLRFDDAKEECETDCTEQGLYSYEINGKNLTFSPYADQCEKRTKHLALSFERIPRTDPNFYKVQKARKMEKTDNKGDFLQGLESYK